MLKSCFTYTKYFVEMKLPVSLYPLNRGHCKHHSSILGDLISWGRSFWQLDWSKDLEAELSSPGQALGGTRTGVGPCCFPFVPGQGPPVTPGAPTSSVRVAVRGCQRNLLTNVCLRCCQLAYCEPQWLCRKTPVLGRSPSSFRLRTFPLDARSVPCMLRAPWSQDMKLRVCLRSGWGAACVYNLGA